MSFFDEFEEINVNDNSTDYSHIFKRVKNCQKETPEKELAIKITNIKYNPDTFDFEKLLASIKQPKKIPSKSPQVVERMLFSHQLLLNKKRFMAQKKEYEEKMSCTFTPEIINNSMEKRSFHDFYEQQKDFINKREEKIKELRCKKNKEILQNELNTIKKVEISSGSRAILKRINRGNQLTSNTVRDCASSIYKSLHSGKENLKQSKRSQHTRNTIY